METTSGQAGFTLSPGVPGAGLADAAARMGQALRGEQCGQRNGHQHLRARPGDERKALAHLGKLGIIGCAARDLNPEPAD
jgi:hypothetical protein